MCKFCTRPFAFSFAFVRVRRPLAVSCSTIGHARFHAVRRPKPGYRRLLAVYMKRCTWKSDCLVTPWFYAIARRELIDAFRRHGKRVQRPIQ